MQYNLYRPRKNGYQTKREVHNYAKPERGTSPLPAKIPQGKAGHHATQESQLAPGSAFL